MEKEKFHLFWGGIFSQWHMARIYDPALDITFNCNEQYMMYMKADTFGDTESMNAILDEHNPREQKKLGRKVKGFDKEVWDGVCREIVTYANYLKFTQNRDLFIELMKYKKHVCFVEASPFDAIWGIGLEETDPDAYDRSKWEGTNWLGEAINDVRDKLHEDHYCWRGIVKK